MPSYCHYLSECKQARIRNNERAIAIAQERMRKAQAACDAITDSTACYRSKSLSDDSKDNKLKGKVRNYG